LKRRLGGDFNERTEGLEKKPRTWSTLPVRAVMPITPPVALCSHMQKMVSVVMRAR